MDWTAAVDAYCERVGPDFWAEPLNALTNAAFLVAAFWALRHWRRQPYGDGAALALIVVVALVGIGSFLFHTLATRWAGLADVIPIAVFIHLYFFFAMRRILSVRLWLAAALTGGFFIAGLALGPQLGRLLGSSGGYAPAALAIFAVALAAWRSPALAAPLAGVGMLFLISLAFRTGDMLVCPSFPSGTHFVWHCLNAAVLYLLIRILMRSSGTAAAKGA
ncbi:ceramidase domain-containing protein [Stappia stellulata]|uniref:ceramidase domain-containing protein n=1 Tax=Stappia stellulata TaxID=71235 RepID=UPI000419DE90|nr:ceramidase domain-containing protein [Stappia stellulata]